MDKKNKHTNIFTIDVIQRYHDGTLSGGERHDLEKAALEDPFLADALEGYRFTSTPQEDLQELSNKLLKKTEKPKVVYFPVNLKIALRIAALLLLLLTAGWGIQLLTNAPGRELSSQTEPDKELVTAPLQAQDSTVGKAATDSYRHEEKTAAKQTASINKTRIATDADNNNGDLNKEGQTARQRSAPVSGKVSNNSVAQLKTDNTQTIESTSLQNNLNEKADGITIKGQVTDAKGTPVPHASVMQPATRQATQTDINGRFQLLLQDTASAVISAMGFQPQKLALTNNNTESKVVLQEVNAGLQEVVITGQNQVRRKTITAPNGTREEGGIPVPLFGWTHFENYVAQRKVPLFDGRGNKIKGEVELLFDLTKEGIPTNISVIKSLCAQCDEEAIRLLKQGPKWKGNMHKKGSLTLRF